MVERQATLGPSTNGDVDVALIAKPGGTFTGVGRYVQMLSEHLESLQIKTKWVSPTVPPMIGVASTLFALGGMDLHAFLTNYPVWAEMPQAKLYHVSSQNLASLLMIRRPAAPVIVTVHDIIPYILRNDEELSVYRGRADRFFDALAMRGLKRADHLVADSEFTKRTLIEQLKIDSKRISVVYLGIDHQRFQPLEVHPSIYERYGLQPDRRYLIFVGSEDPRKNLKTLLHAFADVNRTHSDVELIKVGRAHFESERRTLLKLSEHLGIRDRVHFLDDVPGEDFPLLYNLASTCVMPSLYEGFGFPVLEAMACGTPVVCAQAASLPELADDAAMMFDPFCDDHRRLVARIEQVLDNQDLRSSLISRGLRQAATFTWHRTGNMMTDVYRLVQEVPHQEPNRIQGESAQ
jgi:glycosyltransferase involved in cell wall biosynthesis